jgi:hypothetical protein
MSYKYIMLNIAQHCRKYGAIDTKYINNTQLA